MLTCYHIIYTSYVTQNLIHFKREEKGASPGIETGLSSSSHLIPLLPSCR